MTPSTNPDDTDVAMYQSLNEPDTEPDVASEPQEDAFDGDFLSSYPQPLSFFD